MISIAENYDYYCNFIAKKNLSFDKLLNKWWFRSESNQRHMDFQSIALPTELRNHLVAGEGFEPTTSGL